MVAKLFLLQFYLFGCVIVRLRKMLFAVAGLRPQNILLIFLASLENLKFRYEIVLQPSQSVNLTLAVQNQTAINKPIKTIKTLDAPFGSSQKGKATEPKNTCPTLANISAIALILFF